VFYLPTPAITLPWLLAHEDTWGEIFASSAPGVWASLVAAGQCRQLLPEGADLAPELTRRNEVGALSLALARVCEHNDPVREGVREAAAGLVAAVGAGRARESATAAAALWHPSVDLTTLCAAVAGALS